MIKVQWEEHSTSETFLNLVQRETQRTQGQGMPWEVSQWQPSRTWGSWKDDVMWITIIRQKNVALRLSDALHLRNPQKCWVGFNLVSRGQKQRSLGSSNTHRS